MTSEMLFSYSQEKAQGNLVVLRMATTFIVFMVWNNQLKTNLLFCHSFPLLLDYLSFVTFYLFSINQKQNKKNNVY